MYTGIYEIVVIIMLLLLLCLFFVLVNVPTRIAENRGAQASDLFTIRLLSWCGLFTGGITWIVAVIIALSIDKQNTSGLDRLEKAHKLMKKGVISKKEYEKIKKESI